MHNKRITTKRHVLTFYNPILLITDITILPYVLVAIYEHKIERFRLAMTPFAHICELLGSNFTWDTCYPEIFRDFSYSVQENFRLAPRF
jgi:hypothetical protein